MTKFTLNGRSVTVDTGVAILTRPLLRLPA